MIIYKKRTKESIENIKYKGKIVIKIPIIQWMKAHLWGEYHFALAMKKYLERENWEVLIQIIPEWYSSKDKDFDIVIVLRGNREYFPKKQHLNIMWNICHPNMVSINEYNNYDYVFIASNIWAKHLSRLCSVKVEPLLQCTDTELFFPQNISEYNYELLFVGNSRHIFRKIIKDLLPTNRELSVYGENWSKFIHRKHIKGKHIENKELNKVYSSCKILLNDHWADMREKGFLSNRLFDGFASGAFIISDEIKGGREVFGDALVTYKNSVELYNLIEKYLADVNLRKEKSEKGYGIVVKNHTFEKRVKKIIEVIENRLI